MVIPRAAQSVAILEIGDAWQFANDGVKFRFRLPNLISWEARWPHG